jgi:hypothetical protein
VPGSLSFRDPLGYTSPYPLAEIDPPGARFGQGNEVGWTFRGKDYFRRGDWITPLFLRASGDGKLVLLTGADKRKLPSSGVFFGGPLSDGAYGNVTLDAFESGPEHEVASIDVDCGMTTLDCTSYMTVVNSRWFAVALEKDLRRAVLFDFGPQGSGETK